MAKKIIIDTDPGVDDTIAICTALRSSEVSVIGLTSVFGNATGDVTALNALRLVELEGHGDIPVARGSDVPLFAPLEKIASFVHGDDGMGNTNPPAPKGSVVDLSAAEFIVKMARLHPGEITLVPVGPLTNIALALRLDPHVAENIKEVVIMGGAVSCPGNISPAAEANIYHDPHAADIVLSAGWPLTLVGLDVTQKTIMSSAFQKELFKSDNRAVDLIERILPCYQNYFNTFHGMDGDIFTHDPSAIACVIDPDLFETQSAPVYVETAGRSAGQTTADWKKQWGDRPDVNICVDVKSEGVLALIKDRLTQ